MGKEVKHFDVIVLGGGPGGYPAAIRARQLGQKVALVEAKHLGGTCLNWGCIPTKALLASAVRLKEIKGAEELGIHVKGISFDFKKIVERKDRVVSQLRGNLKMLLKANGIDLIEGFGSFTSSNTIAVTGKDKGTIKGDKIIVATGSKPLEIPSFPFDSEKVLSSNTILDLKALPKHLAIIGAGVIGCELAALYAELGVKVTLIELMERILPMESQTFSATLVDIFKKRGMDIFTSSEVEKIDKTKKGVSIVLKGKKKVEADLALVAIGRQLNTDQIGLNKAGVKVSDKGFVEVNEKMETNVPGIYAIGDITSRWWLAHVATHQGLVAAYNASGKEAKMLYNAIPSVIFTDPPFAKVGYTIDEAKEKGFKAEVALFPYQALGKSWASSETEGFAQFVIIKETGQILGAEIFGAQAGSLISEAALAITNELTLECLVETIHPHPTFSEIWMETASLAMGFPLHLPPRK